MVSSLDGIIAKRDNNVEWFETPDHYEKGESFSSPEEFSKAVDCYIMGSATYEHALELSKELWLGIWRHAHFCPYESKP